MMKYSLKNFLIIFVIIFLFLYKNASATEVKKNQDSISNLISNIENRSPLFVARENYENANKAYLRGAIDCPGCSDLGNLKREQIKARNNYLNEFELANRLRLNLNKKIKNRIISAENNLALFEELYAKSKLLNWNNITHESEVPETIIQDYKEAVNELAELKAPDNFSIQEIIKQISQERVEYLFQEELKKPKSKTELMEEIKNIKNDIEGESSSDEGEEIFKDLKYKLEWNRPLNERAFSLSQRPSTFRPKLKELQRKSKEVIKKQRNLKKLREGSR